MYLTELFIQNNGAIGRLHVRPNVSSNQPSPIVLVGRNGSGKTNALSLVADAIHELGAQHYLDIAGGDHAERPYFRVLNPRNIKSGVDFSIAGVRFEDQHDSITYFEKLGTRHGESVTNDLPKGLRERANFLPEDQKYITASAEMAKRVFESGVYVFFPSSRSEIPYWINGVYASEFDLTTKNQRRLGKPIIVERGLSKIKQWLLGVLLDARADFQARATSSGLSYQTIGVSTQNLLAQSIWNAANNVLKTILGTQAARLVVFNRHTPTVGYSIDQAPDLPLDYLSTGQANLFNVFVTLLRYGDGNGLSALSEIRGICIVDEIDAHMHIDLQRRALPQLIAQFPAVQFILTSHSPFFLLGLKRTHPGKASQIIDMSSGVEINDEEYAEFDHAFEAMTDTQRFRSELVTLANGGKELLVLVEGETDEPYLNKAMELLADEDVKAAIEIKWIGAKSKEHGQGFNTGKDSLNSAFNFLRANPDFLKRKVCLLFDNDAGKGTLDEDLLYIRSVPTIRANDVVEDGIENLIPQKFFVPEVFSVKDTKKPNGTATTVRTVNKAKLCERLCNGGTLEDFDNFLSIVECLKLLIHKT